MNSRLQEMLAPHVRKYSELYTDNTKPMIFVAPNRIRMGAEAFAHHLDYEMPTDKEELIALLWVFGEQIDGYLKQENERLIRQLNDTLNVLGTPVVVVNKP